MEFKKKQYDRSFEIVMVESRIETEVFRGITYFPSSKFEKPHPIIVYFHGFPQITPLQEIARNYRYLLEKGYAF
jgi:dipeptidyl aminopeptidase/acylaminoacyl peptidase